MAEDTYTILRRAWDQRTRLIAKGQLQQASKVWGEAYRKVGSPQIEWDGRNCIIAGTMYFEDTASPKVDSGPVTKIIAY